MFPQLLFVYIKELRNCFNQQEFCFTNDFDISFNEEKLLIEKKGNPYKKLWGGKINNINLIVGKNGAGKSTLLDLLGSTKSSRLKLLEKSKTANNERRSFEEWFALYHIEDDIFVIEGNNPYLLRNLKQVPKLTSDEYSICIKYDFLKKNAKYFDYIQFNKYTRERKSYSLDRKMHALYMSNSVRKDWYLNNQRRDEQDHYVGFKRRYLNNPLYSNIYRFMSEDYKILEKKFTAQNAVCEVRREELYDLFYEEDLANTMEFKLYHDNSKILLFNNDYIFSKILNKDKKNKVENWSVKEKFIIKYLELMVLGWWVNLGRDKLDDSEKQNCINNVESILWESENFNETVKYLKQVLQQIFNSLNDKVSLEWPEFDIGIIDNIIKMLINIKEDFYISDQVISVITNNGLEESIYDFLYFFDGLNEDEIYINIKVRFKNMSSGELEFVNGFANLYSAIQMAIQNKEIDTLLLLLDEPDASFHPEWSRRYIHNIYNFLDRVDYGKDLKYQIIITTHSPFIVSDVPKEHITCIKIQEDGFGRIQRISTKADFGFMSNFYDIIQSDFFITSPIGEHAKYLFEETVSRITSWKEYDEHEIENVNGIISAIGEDVIRAKLQQLLNDKKMELFPYEERLKRIYALEQELKILKNTMDKSAND
jgi:predicted ATPase